MEKTLLIIVGAVFAFNICFSQTEKDIESIKAEIQIVSESQKKQWVKCQYLEMKVKFRKNK